MNSSFWNILIFLTVNLSKTKLALLYLRVKMAPVFPTFGQKIPVNPSPGLFRNHRAMNVRWFSLRLVTNFLVLLLIYSRFFLSKWRPKSSLKNQYFGQSILEIFTGKPTKMWLDTSGGYLCGYYVGLATILHKIFRFFQALIFRRPSFLFCL